MGQFFKFGCEAGEDHDPVVGIGAGNGTDVYDDEEDENDADKFGVEAATVTFVPQRRQNF